MISMTELSKVISLLEYKINTKATPPDSLAKRRSSNTSSTPHGSTESLSTARLAWVQALTSGFGWISPCSCMASRA